MNTARQIVMRGWRRVAALAVVLLLIQSCSPAMPQSPAPSAEEKPAVTQPKAEEVTQPTAAGQPAEPQSTRIRPTQPPPAQPTAVVITPEPVVENRQIELEWPEQMRLGDSDVIRLALVPVKDGYVAQAEFPDHSLQTRPVPVPRPNGFTLYALASLDGVGFEIDPRGEQERFVPEGEEVAWRWTLAPRQPGQQRLSVNLRLRWVPTAGVTAPVRESQAYSRGIHVRVSSFLGLSQPQAASTGVIGLLLGGSMLLFASFIRRGGRKSAPRGAPEGALTVVEPGSALQIEKRAGLVLAGEESGLLRGLFRDHQRLVIENEFLSGYSGARTFLVHPIRADGCADAPTIVKLGARQAIRQEFDNYEAFVKDRLPPMTARIQRAPVVLKAGERAAVQYTFIAEPGKPPVSLRQALLQNPDPGLLLRLFETFGPNWWMQRRPYTFRMAQEYDRLLPPHYVLAPVNETSHASFLSPLGETETPQRINLRVGDLVRLRPFRRVEPRADGQSFSLQGLEGEGQPALRLRWLGAPPPGGPVSARVVSTRVDLLHGWTVDFERFGLKDPLECLPAVLDETVAATRSVIHGDLNLENILAGPGSLVWLIDFAQTREGHPLFDFAHLESELIAHVLSVRCGSPRAYLDVWRSEADPLLNALHGVAGRCLFDPARPREYHLALYLACLGALKYQNLTGLARHCLYLTAAALAEGF